MFYSLQSSVVDFRRHVVADINEEDVRDVVRCASPPVTTGQHVAMDDNLCRSDETLNSEETEIMQKCHVLIITTAIVRTKYDVMHYVRYHEALCIITEKRNSFVI